MKTHEQPGPLCLEVAAGILWRGDRILCCQRPPGKPQAGFWEFPGGKLKPGEDAQAALARELAEELGVFVRTSVFWLTRKHVYEDLNLAVTLHFFHVTAFAGEPCAREGQRLCWVPFGQARDMAFLPADMELVARLTPPQGA